jgi:hypothetical protein
MAAPVLNEKTKESARGIPVALLALLLIVIMYSVPAVNGTP